MSKEEIYMSINEVEAEVLGEHHRKTIGNITSDINRHTDDDMLPSLVVLLREQAERYEQLLIKTGRINIKDNIPF